MEDSKETLHFSKRNNTPSDRIRSGYWLSSYVATSTSIVWFGVVGLLFVFVCLFQWGFLVPFCLGFGTSSLQVLSRAKLARKMPENWSGRLLTTTRCWNRSKGDLEERQVLGKTRRPQKQSSDLIKKKKQKKKKSSKMCYCWIQTRMFNVFSISRPWHTTWPPNEPKCSRPAASRNDKWLHKKTAQCNTESRTE